jgi:hypothetical protein
LNKAILRGVGALLYARPLVVPVQEFMPAALAAILRKAPLTPAKVAFAWRSAVGVAVDKVTTIDLRDGILHVAAKDAVWQREVERSATVIRARLEALLGPNVVRYVDVTVAAARPSGPAQAPDSNRSAGESGTGRPTR